MAEQEKIAWGHIDVAHRLFRVLFQLDDVTDWMQTDSEILRLHTQSVKALNKLIEAAIKADGSAQIETQNPANPDFHPMSEVKFTHNRRTSGLSEPRV